MGFKDFWINSENTNEKPKEKEVSNGSQKTKFPSSTEQPSNTSLFSNFGAGKQTTTTTFTPTSNTGVSQEYVEKALQVYQQGFDSLNQPGYDFYEFYQGLSDEDKTNPSVYPMAFRMASAMDKTITKEKLIGQADFYISKIMESYNGFVSSGNSKKQELLSQKENENHSLTNELSMLQQQLEEENTKDITVRWVETLDEMESKD